MKNDDNFLEVVVQTTSGQYPLDNESIRVPVNQKVAVILKKAAEDLGITNVDGWIAEVSGQTIDTEKSFSDLNLTGLIEIDYRAEVRGGGSNE